RSPRSADLGHGFMVWAVDIERLQQACGSKDAALCEGLCERNTDDLRGLDNLFARHGGPSARDALTQIIDGTAPTTGRNGIYAYAFKLLVKHFGNSLDNSAVYPWNSPDFKGVDGALDGMGVPFHMSRFRRVSLPVKLPYPAEFPSTGWVSSEDTA